MKKRRLQLKNAGLLGLLLGVGITLMPSTGQCFYSPSTGRWLSRDPMEEAGFSNVMRAARPGSQHETDPLYTAAPVDQMPDGADTEQGPSSLLNSRLSGYRNDGRNLYVFVANASTYTFDPLGLCTTVTDDAKRTCCACDILPVELRIQPEAFIGHAFLKTAHLTSGFYPYPGARLIAWWNDEVDQGRVHDDSRHPYSRTRTYTACPLTMFMMEMDMTFHVADNYGLSNAKARNCAGWALERLKGVGFTVPFPPNKRHLKPKDL